MMTDQPRHRLISKFILSAILCGLCCCLNCNAQRILPAGDSLNRSLLELPNTTEEEIIIIHQGYISSFNTEYLIPDWVAYELTMDELDGGVKRNGSFRDDPYYPGLQATNSDYSKSGFDKGHMAPAADMKWSEDAMSESFYFSNICPQTPALNRRNWLNLEKLTRLAAQKYGKVWVISGSMVDTLHTTIGSNNVAVPSSFYKAILAYSEDRYISAAFIMKNNDDAQPITDVIMCVDTLEAIIGKDLFMNLTKNDSVTESFVTLSDWDL